MQPLTSNSVKSRHAGFSLIEVMVTLVIVGFGLLSLVGLMLRGLQTNNDSVLRSIAIQRAYDMTERMRGNLTAVFDGAFDEVTQTTTCATLNGSTTPLVAKPSTPPSCSALCNATSCTPSAQADADTCLWNRDTFRDLPSGSAAVCKTSTLGGNWFTIYVSWDENKSGATNSTFSLRFEP